LRAELDSSGGIAGDRRTIADAIESYEKVRAGQNISASTQKGDWWMLGLIRDGLGHRRLSQLTVADCDRFLLACSVGLTDDRRPVGRSQLKRVRSTLVAVVRNEMRLGAAARNVAELSALPGTERRDGGRRSLTRDELSRLSDGASGAIAVLVDLIGWNGLRPAEARGIRWTDLEVETGRLRVQRQLDASDREVRPKTKASVRTIQLDGQSLDRLEAWRQNQRQLRDRAGQAWMETGLVATTSRGTAINRNNFVRSLRRLCERFDIEPTITPYELRHTAISLQADAGRSSWEIADWAGTSERMVSDVYRHRLSTVSLLGPLREDV
jgi:integrase